MSQEITTQARGGQMENAEVVSSQDSGFGGNRQSMLRRIGLLLTFGAIVCGALAWTASSPIGASPDEPAHIDYSWGSATGQTWPWSIEEERDGLDRVVARIEIPAELTEYPRPKCYMGADYSTACQIPMGEALAGDVSTTSYMAKYPMVYYLFIGFTLKAGLTLGLSGFSALFAARFISAVLSFGLVALAGWILSKRYDWRAIAIPVALLLVPNAQSQFASINPNGFEISSAVLLAAIVVAIRSDVGAERGVSAAMQIGLVLVSLALGWTRPMSIAWLGLILLLLLIPVNEHHVIREISKLTTALVIFVCLFLFGWLVYQATGVTTQDVSSDLSLWENHPFLLKAAVILLRFGSMLQTGFGTMGWADTSLPTLFFVIWLVVGSITIGAAISSAKSKRCSVGITLIVGVFLGSILLIFIESLHAAFGWQGRYWLPIVAACLVLLVPLLNNGLAGRQHVARFVWAPVATMAGIGVFAVIFNMWRYEYGFNLVYVRFEEFPYPWRDPAWIPAGGNGAFYVSVALSLLFIVSAVGVFLHDSRHNRVVSKF